MWINAEKLKEELVKAPVWTTLSVMEMIDRMAGEMPKRGEWIVYEGEWKDFDYYPPKCKCNQCGYEEELYILNAKPTNFCPYCGSRMKGADDE